MPRFAVLGNIGPTIYSFAQGSGPKVVPREWIDAPSKIIGVVGNQNDTIKLGNLFGKY